MQWRHAAVFALFLVPACGGGGEADVAVGLEGGWPIDAAGEARVPDSHLSGDDGPFDVRRAEGLIPPDKIEITAFELPPEAFADWGPEPGTQGYPCTSGAECNEGYCIVTPDGKQCTVTCVDECALGWTCAVYAPALPDEVFVCTPRFTSLCRPCLVNSDCMVGGLDLGQACLKAGGAGSFCGTPCAPAGEGESEPCPPFYACEQATEVSGAMGQYCRPATAQCTCSQVAIDDGATTTCFEQNQWGMCKGERTCLASGLTPCSAVVPAQETCNAADDDCDETVDEETGGGACLVSNVHGACPGLEICSAGQVICTGPIPAAESCDGDDNDCDGLADEGFPDTDQDGIADCLEGDIDGDGKVDVLDNCPTVPNAGQEDFDLDMFGDACDPDDDNDMAADKVDCQPLDPFVYPKAVEVCNGKDDNCDGLVDEGFEDQDTDGWKNCVDDDDDNDGSIDAADCAPLDADRFPGAKETCDGVDNDCDFDVDESFPDTDDDGEADCVDTDLDGDGVLNGKDNCPATPNQGQQDQDKDGLGDLCDADLDGDSIPDAGDNCPGLKNTSQSDIDDDGLGDPCDADMDGDAAPNGSDNCPLVPNKGQADTDKDGIGDACETDTDGDGSPDEQDCQDLDPAIHPGAKELCDGLDNNCNFVVDEGFADFDADGLKDCLDQDDDDDGDPDLTDCAPKDKSAGHGVVETCDAKDNDCDGQIDDSLGTVACGKGLCVHKVSACLLGKLQTCDPFEGVAPEQCDGKDNDCDGLTDEDLGTTKCGLGLCEHVSLNCLNGQPAVCDSMLGAVQETCDGQDNDCDGGIDDNLGTLTCGQGICQHSLPACVGGVAQQCDPFQGAGKEICDGADNDCNGKTDDGFGSVTCGQGVCKHEQPYCVEGKIVVCDPFLGAGPEQCDGLDNDCDGVADDDFGIVLCGLGLCQHQMPLCSNGVPQECDPLQGAAKEICDAVDNDCDGDVDEQLGFSKCGIGVCEHLVQNCIDGAAEECDPMLGSAGEICDGKDNDCNGEADPEDSIGCLTYYADADSDGYGELGKSRCLCKADLPYSATVPGDCNDGNGQVNPGMAENCYSLADDNCNDKINESCIYKSCKTLLANNPGTPTGIYTLDPDGDGAIPKFNTHCDMASSDGGWTLVARMKGGSWCHISVDSAGELSGPAQALCAKVSDAAIRALYTEQFWLHCDTTNPDRFGKIDNIANFNTYGTPGNKNMTWSMSYKGPTYAGTDHSCCNFGDHDYHSPHIIYSISSTYNGGSYTANWSGCYNSNQGWHRDGFLYAR